MITMDFVCGTLIPIFFTVVAAWMTCTLIGMAWLVKQFRADMERRVELTAGSSR